MSRRLQRLALFGTAVGVAIVAASSAHATASPVNLTPGAMPNTGDFGISTLTNQITNHWVPTLTQVAADIFVALAVLEFVWMVALSFISGRTIGELLGQWVPKMLAFSLFFYFLVLHGVDVANVIITSFTGAAGPAAAAGGVPNETGVSPVSLMQTGFNLTWPMMIYAIVFAAIPNFFSGFFFSFGISNLQVPVIFIQMFGATLTIGAYVFLGGTLLITIIEAYLVSVFGLLMAGFAPLRTTNAYGTQKVIGYAMSVGVKLLVLYLVIGLIQTVIAPIIAAAAAIPVAGALTVGFYGIILALIAYNVPTFAATIVSGMAQGNASAGVGAMTAAVGSATMMAQSMHHMSEGMHDKQESKKLGKQADDRVSSEEQGQTHKAQASTNTPGATPTGLSAHEMPSSGAQSVATKTESTTANTSFSQGSNGTSSASAQSGTARTDSVSVSNAQATIASNSQGKSEKALPQEAAGARAAAAENLPTGSAKPSIGELKKEDHRSLSEKTEDAFKRGYGAESKGSDDKETMAARAEFRQLQDQEFKSGNEEMKQGIDGFGKAFGQMLTPAGGASSGAVAGATLRSSV